MERGIRRPPRGAFGVAIAVLIGLALGADGRAQTGGSREQAVKARKGPPMTAQEADEHPPADFPLRGKHRELSCDDCHLGKEPKPSCRTCHTPPHGPGFTKTCEDCHTAGMPFAQVKYAHPPKGLWAFHDEVACIGCHAKRLFKGTPRECASCHADYHKGALGRSCGTCHREPAWTVTRFNHSRAGFPLAGAHRAIECADCHRDRQSFRIVPRPSSCAGCHESAYRSSPFPHALYGAGRDCQTCHLQDGWEYAHSPAWFNIRSGDMAGIDCATCHQTSGNYAVYTCHACHQGHSGDHNGMCLDCHRGGFGEGGGDLVRKKVIKK